MVPKEKEKKKTKTKKDSKKRTSRCLIIKRVKGKKKNQAWRCHPYWQMRVVLWEAPDPLPSVSWRPSSLLLEDQSRQGKFRFAFGSTTSELPGNTVPGTWISLARRERQVAHDSPRRGWSPGHVRPPEPIPGGLPETHPLRLPRYLPAAWWQAGPPLGRSSAAAAGGPRMLRHSSPPRSGPVGRPFLPHHPHPQFRDSSGLREGPNPGASPLFFWAPQRFLGPAAPLPVRFAHPTPAVDERGRGLDSYTPPTYLGRGTSQPRPPPTFRVNGALLTRRVKPSGGWQKPTSTLNRPDVPRARRKPPALLTVKVCLPPIRFGWVPWGLGRKTQGWASSAGSLKDYAAIYLLLRERRRSQLCGCQRLATRAGESPGGGGGAGAGRRRRARARSGAPAAGARGLLADPGI